MKISSSFNSNYRMQNSQSFNGLPAKTVFLPEWLGKAGKWAGEYVSMPEQKLFLAATAFLFQPAIDMKFAEEDKKSDVAIKSASKAIAGGITGVAIRALSEKYFRSKIGYDANGDKKVNLINDYLFPPKAAKLRERSKTAADIMLKKYASTLSIVTALAVMILVTNEKLDVPITSDLQDLYTYVARDNKSWKDAFKEVGKSRINKIKISIKRQKEFVDNIKNKCKRIFNIIKEDNPIQDNKGGGIT